MSREVLAATDIVAYRPIRTDHEAKFAAFLAYVGREDLCSTEARDLSAFAVQVSQKDHFQNTSVRIEPAFVVRSASELWTRRSQEIFWYLGSSRRRRDLQRDLRERNSCAERRKIEHVQELQIAK